MVGVRRYDFSDLHGRERRTLPACFLLRCRLAEFLEPISKSFEEDHEAGELDEAEEVLAVVLPADEDAALPLDPGEEAFDDPTPRVAAEPPPILSERFSCDGAVRGIISMPSRRSSWSSASLS